MRRPRPLTCVYSALLIFITVLAATMPAATAAAAAPAAATWRLCFPYAPKLVTGDNATLLLTATMDGLTTGNIFLRQPDGAQVVATQPFTLTAQATEIIDLAAEAGLPEGIYQVEVTSSQELAGVAHIRSASGSVGVYAPVNCAQGSDEMFGPFYDASQNGPASTLHLMNSGNEPATVQLSLVETGYMANLSIPAHGGTSFTTGSLPDGVQLQEGWGRIQVTTTSANIHGVLAKEWNEATTYANALWNNTVDGANAPALVSDAYLPRLHVRSTETGAAFTTQLLVAVPGGGWTMLNMSAIRANGTQAGTPAVSQIPGGGAAMYNVTIWDDGIHSLVIGSNQQLVVQAKMIPMEKDGPGEQTRHSADSLILPRYATSLVIPGVIADANAFAVLGVQNSGVSPSTVTVRLVNTQGQEVHIAQFEVAAGAAATLDVSAVSGLPIPFQGAALVTSSGPVVGQVDVYSEFSVPDQSLHLPLIVR